MSRLSHGTWTRKSAQCAFIAVFNKVKAPGAGIVSRCLSLAVIGVLLCGGVTAAHAQNEDLKDALLKKLNDQFVLTKMTADGMDVVTAGSTVTLHRDGLQMCSVQAKLPMPNVYRDGKISAGKFAWALSMGMVQPNLPSSQVPIRPFVADEKFWVTAVGVEHNEVVFKFYSDAYQDVRYYAQLAFPFNKKSAPSADDLLKMIAEVVTAEPPSTSQGDAPGAAPTSAPPAAPMAPVPPPAPMPAIAPPPPPADTPPAPTKTISLGDTKDHVIAAFGQPQKVVQLGTKEIDYYPDMKVTFIKGKVTDVQ